jgi:hypothetical protein
MPLAEAAKSRVLTEEEAKTWAGLEYAGSGNIKAGPDNPPSLAGFAVQGPVILIGNPEDHDIIAFLQKHRFLPYAPSAAKLPGPGRGLFAWQRDGIGPGQESFTLIAYDAEGMNEAVGSFYEAVAGIEPLTKYALPKTDAITPASSADVVPRLGVTQVTSLPDRVTGLKLADGKISALSHDGTLLTGAAAEAANATRQVVPATDYAKLVTDLATPTDAGAIAAAQKQSQPTQLVKFAVPHGDLTAVVCWGGVIELRDSAGAVKSRTRLPQDISAAASSGGKLLVGLCEGSIFELK